MPSRGLSRDRKGAAAFRVSALQPLRLIIHSDAKRRQVLLGGLQAEGFPKGRVFAPRKSLAPCEGLSDVRKNFGPPMTLANMRQNGVHALIATCACGHKADVNVDALPETTVCPRSSSAALVQRVWRQADQYAARLAHGARQLGPGGQRYDLQRLRVKASLAAALFPVWGASHMRSRQGLP